MDLGPREDTLSLLEQCALTAMGKGAFVQVNGEFVVESAGMHDFDMTCLPIAVVVLLSDCAMKSRPLHQQSLLLN